MPVASSQDAKGLERTNDLLDDDAHSGLHAIVPPLLQCQRLAPPPFVRRGAAGMAALDPLVAALSPDGRRGVGRHSAACVEPQVVRASFARAHSEDLPPGYGDRRLQRVTLLLP